MARQARMLDYQHDDHPEQQQLVPVPAGRRDDDDDGDRHLVLDAGRALMLWGWGALAAASASGQKNDDDDDSSIAVLQALLAFVLWLLGVSLVALVLVTERRRQFPRAALLGAAAANAVFDCFFMPPWN